MIENQFHSHRDKRGNPGPFLPDYPHPGSHPGGEGSFKGSLLEGEGINRGSFSEEEGIFKGTFPGGEGYRGVVFIDHVEAL